MVLLRSGISCWWWKSPRVLILSHYAPLAYGHKPAIVPNFYHKSWWHCIAQKFCAGYDPTLKSWFWAHKIVRSQNNDSICPAPDHPLRNVLPNFVATRNFPFISSVLHTFFLIFNRTTFFIHLTFLCWQSTTKHHGMECSGSMWKNTLRNICTERQSCVALGKVR